MGWWSNCIMGGDTPYDAAGRATAILQKGRALYRGFNRMHMPDDWSPRQQATVRKAIEQYTFANFFLEMTADVYQDDRAIYAQVAGLIAISCGIKLTDSEKCDIIRASLTDEWAQDDDGRLDSILQFIWAVTNYKGQPVKIEQEGLLEKMASKMV